MDQSNRMLLIILATSKSVMICLFPWSFPALHIHGPILNFTPGTPKNLNQNTSLRHGKLMLVSRLVLFLLIDFSSFF